MAGFAVHAGGSHRDRGGVNRAHHAHALKPKQPESSEPAPLRLNVRVVHTLANIKALLTAMVGNVNWDTVNSSSDPAAELAKQFAGSVSSVPDLAVTDVFKSAGGVSVVVVSGMPGKGAVRTIFQGNIGQYMAFIPEEGIVV